MGQHAPAALWVAALLCGGGAGGVAGAAPDATRGEQLYGRCAACHSFTQDRVGPRHCGLFGRLAGSVPEFDYSAAMKASNIRWNDASLDRFLADPTRTVPGTTMTYAGVDDAKERADLVAYLKAVNASAACRP